VQAIAITGADRARNQYLIGTPGSARQAALAAQFIDLVTGARGREVLNAAGFGQ
jgi:ABC-type molybdate transport system substrate-binding protein